MQASILTRRAASGAVVRNATRKVSVAAPTPAAIQRSVRVNVAETTEVSSASEAPAPEQFTPAINFEQEMEDLEMAELDEAQEQLLAWFVDHNEQQQDEDLDEAVDYDEFADAEYAAIYDEVERMIESSYSDIRIGDKVIGTVYDVDDDGAYVEIGEKASGFVPLAECSFAKLKTPLEVLRVGMTREFVVVNREDENGQMVLSLAVLEASIFWQRMQQLMAEQIPVTVKVESANRGGLLVKYGPYDGFIPVGQFGSAVTLENMEALVGQDLPVKFISVDEDNERLVFSAKQTVGFNSETQDLKMGDVVEGAVQLVKPYGVFVDIGGVTGLLHVSQISNGRITSVDKVFQPGDKIKVMVLSMDRDRGRITLSTKKLEVNPGDMIQNPQKVYEHAEEQAAIFKERIQQAQASAQDPAVSGMSAEEFSTMA